MQEILSHAEGRSSYAGIAWFCGFYFAFRIFSVVIAVRMFGLDPQTGVAVSLAINFFLLPVVWLLGGGKALPTWGQMLSPWPVRWCVLFLAMTGASLMWTVAASLPAAVAFWAAMAADFLIVLCLIRNEDAEVAACGILRGYVIGAVVISLLAWLMPAQSDLRLGDEELLGPNQIGYVCAMGLLFVQYLVRERKGRWVIAVLVLAITLLRSLSKTTIIALVVCEAYLLWRDRSVSRRTKTWIFAGVLAIAAMFSTLLVDYYTVYTNAGNQAETLTGRLGIWAYILNEAVERPWMGHGFHSVWKVIPPFGDFEARHAHNELLQQFYAYGVMGLVLWVGVYGSFLRFVRTRLPKAQSVFWTGVILFVVVRGLADTEAFDYSLPMWAMALIVDGLHSGWRSRAEKGPLLEMDGSVVAVPR